MSVYIFCFVVVLFWQCLFVIETSTVFKSPNKGIIIIIIIIVIIIIIIINIIIIIVVVVVILRSFTLAVEFST
jgi:hypothetical protein